MATQENSPGLLSKMVRFVRNPTKDWTEVGAQDSIPASDFGKEALKQVIDAKRHDDAIRRREFRFLRKLRQASPAVKAELSHETSTFRSSLGEAETDSVGRSSTLKKIDEIEAQMSRQWWKNSPIANTASKGAVAQDTSSEGATSTFPDTVPSQIDTNAKGQSGPLPPTSQSQEFQATVPGLGQLHASGGYSVSAHSAFSPSKLVLLDLGQNLSDPEMEEAAIRYANGDDTGAEAALQSALQIPDAPPEKAIRWASALLDLYRCIGQQSNFERLAIDYAQRFGRSPPAWIAPYQASVSQPSANTPQGAPAELPWICPARIDETTVLELDRLVCLTTVNYMLNWSGVKEIAESATKSLAALFARWCQRDLCLRLQGGAALICAIQALTPSGDKTVAQQLWQLRFDALRLLNLQDDYEIAALEFCVTYELSPPAWRDPVCKRIFSKTSTLAPLDAMPTGRQSMASTGFDSAQTFAVQLNMSNEVLGDVANLVAQWQSLVSQNETLVISCDRLIRVDFSAAGGLLNWVANLNAQERQVEFHEVPRLVAAFFNLIGINEHAKVLARTH